MRQDIRSGNFDTITPGEMSSMLHEHFSPSKFSALFREQYRGIKLFKLPALQVTATTTSPVLASTPGNVAENTGFVAIPGGGSANCGPEQGYLWLPRRITIASSVLTDTASVALYIGSDFSGQQKSLIDAVNVKMNAAYFPASKAVWIRPGEEVYAILSAATIGNTYTLTGDAIEVPYEMQGKLAAG
jgi:hypothetical protein